MSGTSTPMARIKQEPGEDWEVSSTDGESGCSDDGGDPARAVAATTAIVSKALGMMSGHPVVDWYSFEVGLW